MIAPLFVDSIATLKAALRLSGGKPSSDFDTILETALLTVRTSFYRELTKTRVDEILAFAVAATPTTDNEILRAVAKVTEILWTKCQLIDALPLMFLDSAGNVDESWDTEGLFRGSDTASRESLRGRLWVQVQENLELLKGTQAIGGETTVKATTFEPDQCVTIRPGETAGIDDGGDV